MDGVRLRLQFEDRRILSRSQRKEGLKRSWIVLRTHHRTVAEVAYHILHAFELQDSCPHGLVLYMDGFVLPSFESTSVLKDKDVVWVKKKERTSDGNHVEKSAIANPDYKKRKSLEELKSPKIKRSRLANAEESPTVHFNARNEEPVVEKKSFQGGKVSLKCSQLVKVESSNSKGKSKVCGDDEIKEHAEKPKQSTSPRVLGDDRNKDLAARVNSSQDYIVLLKYSQFESKDAASALKNGRVFPVLSQSPSQEKREQSLGESLTPSDAKKLPSRNARRKKLKKEWIREMKKIGKKVDGQRYSSGVDNWRNKFLCSNDQTLVSHDDHSKSEAHIQHCQSPIVVAAMGNQQRHQYKSFKDVNVPTEIRAGHVRFDPLDGADRPVQESPVPVRTISWNGVTNKKWGKEKVHNKCANYGYQKPEWADKSYQNTKWNDSNNQKITWNGSDCQNTGTDNKCQEGAWNDSHKLNQSPPQEVSRGNETHSGGSTDFTKLSPYGPVPVEGDIVAYRVIELSSSWIPEFSPFRVGQISSYNNISKKIRLVPVPEHPLDEKIDKMLYGEDGTLLVLKKASLSSSIVCDKG
ncbi:hypothetical protein SAY87_028846 [Trapa incisa]|uniref:Coilin n=1 Tax=Trapa incisa TaxID=236973 RepID=A0AAN7L3M0_9MYRT|nr:hypothetical protein SAY87_028846 [Trapa incisa]